MPSGDESGVERVNRRRLLQALTAVSTVGIAGCGGQSGDGGDGGDSGGGGGGGGGGDGGDGGGDGGDGGSQDLGERVPTIQLFYWAAAGVYTNIHEALAPVIQDGVESLGVGLEVDGVALTQASSATFEDRRNHHLSLYSHSFPPSRLEPDEMTRRFGADWASADGNGNPANYANCEHTHIAIGQRTQGNPDERRSMVQQAHAIMSEEAANIPIVRNVTFSAVNTNAINIDGVGESGFREQNPRSIIKSTPASGNSYSMSVISPSVLETTNFLLNAGTQIYGVWSHLINSPLIEFDENFELQNVLADSYSVENDGLRYVVELADATFHNGEPVTSEDVKFTFEQLIRGVEAGAYPAASDVPYESIETPDEKTAVINLEEVFPPLTTRTWPKFGILYKDGWEAGGAVESPADFQMDPIVGSGPFQVGQFQANQFARLEPHDGHPTFSPSHTVTLHVYDSNTAAFRALDGGELQAVSGIPPTLTQRVRDDFPDTEVITARGFTSHQLYPQQSFPPQQFLPFRQAVGAVINRQRGNQLAYNGQSDPILYSGVYLDNHPWINQEDMTAFTDSPQGDAEQARQYLSDAGWGWDDDGNLRYPADLDISPRWPEGEEATSEDGFPCLTSDGMYAGPP